MPSAVVRRFNSLKVPSLSRESPRATLNPASSGALPPFFMGLSKPPWPRHLRRHLVRFAPNVSLAGSTSLRPDQESRSQLESKLISKFYT